MSVPLNARVLRPAISPRHDEPLTLSQLMQRAMGAYRNGEWIAAERLCRAAVNANGDFFDALHLLGVIAAQTRRTREAVDLLSRAVAVDPKHAPAHCHLGNALRGLNRRAEALRSFDRALALDPDFAEAYNNRGNALCDLQRYSEALKSFDRALALKPDLAEAHYNRGVALGNLQRPAEALRSYERALAWKPDYVDAWNNRGNALDALKRPAEALKSYERALALKPDFVEAHSNRGNALRALKRPADALESYERALSQMPGYAEAHSNRGNVLRELNRPADAMASYERALALKPDDASARFNLAVCRLLLGDFEHGWAGYESRWKRGRPEDRPREFAQPLWLGAPTLEGKTILLHGEQGFGDTLQFCRYAKDVAALGATVLLEVPPSLAPLLAPMEGVTRVLPQGKALPAFHYHCPLMSLPLALNTRLDGIPSGAPYIRSDPGRVAAWARRLGTRSKPRVGLVWSGNPAHAADHYRSMALAQLLPVVCGACDWVSLQKDVRDSDAALLDSRPDIRQVSADIGDFADTAALVELMDVVVTVDTSVAHLAGAMGKTVWILLAYSGDWRWLLDRGDSAWYPTARLFRQPALDDWASVVSRVRDELGRHVRALCERPRSEATDLHAPAAERRHDDDQTRLASSAAFPT